MLIRVRGSNSGIRKYLEGGRKDGRNYSRAELDERVILSGDLELTDAIINSMGKQGERYLHITLAFKEEEISREQLQAITDEFQQFAMTAYEADEYNFYAEAHLPRLKSYTNQLTGEFVERKPHIHIVIPEYNLLSQRNLNPFGKVDQQTKFLEAFQEHINAKYGLASPKDNRRVEFTDESAMIARYKGDYFKGANNELKERILSAVLDRGVTDFDQFRAIAAEHGDIKIRNAGKTGEYLNVKPRGAARGINLKDHVFSREFIELPADEKRRRLAGGLCQAYDDAQAPRPTPADIDDRLKEWHEFRAAELKYLNSGSRKTYAAYREADSEQRRAMLAERAASFYAKHRAAQEPEPQPEPPTPTKTQREPAPLPSPASERDGRPADTVVGQRIAERHEAASRDQDAGRAEIDTIKRELDAARLLATVSRTHGVMPDKYAVTKAKDGSDRIRCGRRNLNVTDFLTQELHLPWREAALVLRRTYAEQQRKEARSLARVAPRRELWHEYRLVWLPQQHEVRQQDWREQIQRERERRAALRRILDAERYVIINDRYKTSAERKAALSIARMYKVQRDLALRDQIESERASLKSKYRLKPDEQYRVYILAKASEGDAAALAELRRQRQSAIIMKTVNHISSSTFSEPEELSAQIIPLNYSVDQSGAVTYYADTSKNKVALIDIGQRVYVEAEDRATIEIGLRLALQKFGPHLNVTGSENFRRLVTNVAAQAGLRIEFKDPVMSSELQRLRAEAITQEVQPVQPVWPAEDYSSQLDDSLEPTRSRQKSGPKMG